MREGESETPRDGAFSYYGEVHAFTLGVYAGLVHSRVWSHPDTYARASEQYEDVRREPWYYKGGYVCGTLLQTVLLLVVVWLWFQVGPVRIVW